MKETDIEDCTPHDLRRTFGTQALLKGLDIYKVSKLLGHNRETFKGYYIKEVELTYTVFQNTATKAKEVIISNYEL